MMFSFMACSLDRVSVMPGKRSQACADCVNLSAMPGIHVFLCAPRKRQDVDGIGPRACPRSALIGAASRVNPTCGDPRACPRSALIGAASRVNPTCGDKPGHDG